MARDFKPGSIALFKLSNCYYVHVVASSKRAKVSSKGFPGKYFRISLRFGDFASILHSWFRYTICNYQGFGWHILTRVCFIYLVAKLLHAYLVGACMEVLIIRLKLISYELKLTVRPCKIKQDPIIRSLLLLLSG